MAARCERQDPLSTNLARTAILWTTGRPVHGSGGSSPGSAPALPVVAPPLATPPLPPAPRRLPRHPAASPAPRRLSRTRRMRQAKLVTVRQDTGGSTGAISGNPGIDQPAGMS